MKVDFDPNDMNIYSDPEYWKLVDHVYHTSLKLGLEDDPQMIELNKQTRLIREQALREMQRIKRENNFRWRIFLPLRKVYQMFVSFNHFLYSIIEFK